MRAAVLSILLVLPILAGCIDEATDAEPDDPVPEVDPATYNEGRFQVDVPVPVILVGFPTEIASELAAALPNLRPNQIVYNNARLVSEDLADPDNAFGGGGPGPNPMDPTAVFNYYNLDGAKERIIEQWDRLTIEANVLDANAVDDLLHEEIQAAGIPISKNTTGFVLLHLGSNDHAYRLVYPTGYIDGVRAFGERHPYTVLDVSAKVDSYVGTRNSFNQPIDAEGSASILQDAVERATWYRALQGPIYPQSIRECHAVTPIVVTRGTSISQNDATSYSKADDLLDAEYLQEAWESLLGEGRVHVDGKIIHLPTDDPAMEAVVRDQSNEALRAYMDENWDDYHVDHTGCEEYMSVFLIGDFADSGISGIAMYDINDDRRISMSWMNDADMFAMEEGEVGLLYSEDPSRDYNDWVNFLLSHETGHLFGQRHPHDISAQGGPPGGHTFAAIWSAMSYQQDGKMPLFGEVDTNNYWRNRAGFIAQAAALNGAEGTPEFEEALQLMGEFRWQAAGDVLQPIAVA